MGSSENPEWDTLYQAADREGLDSPSRFDVRRYTTFRMPAARPQAAPPSVLSTPQMPQAPQARAPLSPQTARPRATARPLRRSVKSMVRPYARTGGRTHSEHDLALEALISTTDLGRRPDLVVPTEHRHICELCVDAHSVAEIAAYLLLPLSVVKIFCGDLADAGLVLIHRSTLLHTDPSARDFMERVLQGLREL